jgi:hypothetical protein
MKIIKITSSPRKNKRYRVFLNDGNYYDFGLLGGSTYIDHHDKIKRDNYRKRHYVMEKKFIDKLTPSPSLFSYYLLWGDSDDINKNIMHLNKLLN